jgi:phenylacetate-CoA ligase
VFASPGPIYDPKARGADYWRTGARAVRRRLPCRRPGAQHLLLPLHAGRLDDGDRRARARLHGVSRRRRPDRAAGAAIADLQPNGYVGTPSFLRILLEKADELGIDVSSR